jgi:hypothetical protein
LIKFDIRDFFENLSIKFKFHSNPTSTTDTFHKDALFTSMTISRWILLRMRNVSNESCTEHQNTHFMFRNFFRKPFRLWDNVSKYVGARDSARWQNGGAFHATRAQTHASARAAPTPSHTHASTHLRVQTRTQKFVTLVAFPRQQWIRERASITRYFVFKCLLLVHCVGYFNDIVYNYFTRGFRSGAHWLTCRHWANSLQIQCLLLIVSHAARILATSTSSTFDLWPLPFPQRSHKWDFMSLLPPPPPQCGYGDVSDQMFSSPNCPHLNPLHNHWKFVNTIQLHLVQKSGAMTSGVPTQDL